MYHRIRGFTGHEKKVYMSLISCLIHEGHVVDSTVLDHQPNLGPTFVAIRFDCLLDINEKIYPIFVIQFYKSVRLIHKLNGTIAIDFIINNFEITLTLEKFARILKIPCQGVCVYTPEWPISSLKNVIDYNPDIYPPPQEDSSLICDALFYERTQPKTRKMKGVDTFLDPFQMILSELKTYLKKWEIILSENAKTLQPAYYIAHRMVSVTKSADMTLPYRILLTRLFKHAHTNHPYSFLNELYLVNHTMIHVSKKRVFRFKHEGKIPRLLTPTPSNSESSDSPSPTPHQRMENDPVNNYTLDPIPCMNQLPPIEGGESPKFKQTKGMFKCLFHFLSKKK
ncbi:hypothetical protein Tco_0499201 [Tanacetum coccineum]